MKNVYIKNFLQFRQTLKSGMVLRRVWFHKIGVPEAYDREVLKVQTNGFWLEDLDCEVQNDQGLWCDWGTSKDWVFKDGRVYMIFNHERDYEQKKESLPPTGFEQYKLRYANYLKTLFTTLTIKDFKVLAIYEVLENEETAQQ